MLSGLPYVQRDVHSPARPEPFAYHFFVSYTARDDEVKQLLPLIDEFISQFRRAGFRVKERVPFYLDRIAIGKFDGGDEDLEKILSDAVDDSACMVAFVSPSYIGSQWCQLEWRWMANEGHKWILPVVWKDLGSDDEWRRAGDLMQLSRWRPGPFLEWPPKEPFGSPPVQPDPTVRIHQLIKPPYRPIYPKAECCAVETFGMEFLEGLECAVRETYAFVLDRTASGRRRRNPQRQDKDERLERASWSTDPFLKLRLSVQWLVRKLAVDSPAWFLERLDRWRRPGSAR